MAKTKLTAMDGYFMAMREVCVAIEQRVKILEGKQRECLEGKFRGNYQGYEDSKRALEQMRDYVHNVMLWDTKND